MMQHKDQLLWFLKSPQGGNKVKRCQGQDETKANRLQGLDRSDDLPRCHTFQSHGVGFSMVKHFRGGGPELVELFT